MARSKTSKIRKKRHYLSLDVYIKILILVVLLYGAGMLIAYIPRLSIFRIKTVEANMNIDKDIVREIKGNSIISINTKAVYNQIVKRHSEIKEVRIIKKFPSTLIIKALKRRPFAQLKANRIYVLDDDGVVLEKRKGKVYPGIFIIDIGTRHLPLNVGVRAEGEQISLAYKLIKELNQSGLARRFKITDIDAASPYNISFSMEGINVIVGKRGFHSKIYLLKQLIDKKLRGRMHSIRYIDLRFASNSDSVYIGNKR